MIWTGGPARFSCVARANGWHDCHVPRCRRRLDALSASRRPGCSTRRVLFVRKLHGVALPACRRLQCHASRTATRRVEPRVQRGSPAEASWQQSCGAGVRPWMRSVNCAGINNDDDADLRQGGNCCAAPNCPTVARVVHHEEITPCHVVTSFARSYLARRRALGSSCGCPDVCCNASSIR